MRLMVAGTGSGCGKTTVTLALLTAMRQRGLRVAPFKSGPDYIDPGFHRLAAGCPSHNLDPFLMTREDIAQVLALGMDGKDVGVIEGAMSYYDGIGPQGDCSAWSLAVQTGTPALLVVDAAGSATGAAAEVLGFQTYRTPSQIGGVLVNRVSSEGHFRLVRDAVEARTGIPCVGYMRRDDTIHLDSRHLGLVPAEELADFQEKLCRAAGLLWLDWEKLLAVARAAEPMQTPPPSISPSLRGFRMGVARDAAFSFYYEANLEMLRRMGMELVFFSPLEDAALPDGLDGLYLGGGFPEVFAGRLSENSPMLGAIRRALEGGLRCYAECGGMMYLSEAIDGVPMVGFLPLRCRMTDRLQRFGYVHVRDLQDGTAFRAHEFHHSLEEGDEAMEKAFEIRRAFGAGAPWQGGYRKSRTLAGYPHIHFWNNEALVRHLWGLEATDA